MARISIPVTKLSRSGVNPPAQTTADATNKHQILDNDGFLILEVVSNDAGAQSISVEIPETVDGVAVGSKVISVGAGATVLAGPFPSDIYGSTLLIDPSVSTTLKFRAYKVA